MACVLVGPGWFGGGRSGWIVFLVSLSSARDFLVCVCLGIVRSGLFWVCMLLICFLVHGCFFVPFGCFSSGLVGFRAWLPD